MSDIVIYGRGKTGQSLYKMLLQQGKEAVFYDDAKGFDEGGAFEKDSLVILSPGVKPYSSGVIQALNVGSRLTSELEYCFSYCSGKCISVTGTNGKTTVCEMIYRLLQSGGLPCKLLGNGGVPFSSQALQVDSDELVVLESSSFMLMNSVKFAPYVSVFTNVAEDHLDYHKTYENYIQAKINNFVRQKEGYAIFNADDDSVRELSELCRCKKLSYSVSSTDADCFFDGENVVVRLDGTVAKAPAKYLRGYVKHNLYNALGAILAAYCVGVSVEISAQALSSFRVQPHRMQVSACVDGVTFVDDSKATNVHAALSAIEEYKGQNLALILGGSDKGESFDRLFAALSSNARAVTASGDTAAKIAACGKKYGVEVVVFDDIRQAVDYCYKNIKNCGGGVVLMSNACASFDKFRDYAERGEYFNNAVKELSGDKETY